MQNTNGDGARADERSVALPQDCQYLQNAEDCVVAEGASAFTHLARVKIRGRSTRAYVKAYQSGDTAQLIGEVVGYTLARRAGLPQPEVAGLIHVPRSVLLGLPQKSKIAFDDPHLCFATAEVLDANEGRVRSFATVENVASASNWTIIGRQALQKFAETWPHFSKMVAIDAWTANVDRNLQNVLWVSASEFKLIDHGQLFGGYQINAGNYIPWPACHCAAETAFPSKLVDELLKMPPILSDSSKASIVNCAEQISCVYGQSRSELDFWLQGASADFVHRAHHWLWARTETPSRYLSTTVGMLDV